MMRRRRLGDDELTVSVSSHEPEDCQFFITFQVNFQKNTLKTKGSCRQNAANTYQVRARVHRHGIIVAIYALVAPVDRPRLVAVRVAHGVVVVRPGLPEALCGAIVRPEDGASGVEAGLCVVELDELGCGLQRRAERRRHGKQAPHASRPAVALAGGVDGGKLSK